VTIAPTPRAAGAASSGVRRRTLSQAIAEELAGRIQNGEYAPGDALPTERDLMDQFGVGRSSARESMQALAVMGLIDIRPGRGARVVAIDSRAAVPSELIVALLDGQAVNDLYEFRACAESQTAALAAERATAADLRAISEALEDYRRAVDRGADLAQADVDFHRTLARAARNVVFEQVLAGLTDLLNFARREVMSVPWVPARALRDHVLIAEAVAARDPAAARAAMLEHVAGGVEAVNETRRNRGSSETALRDGRD